MTKQELREQFREKRNAISDDDRRLFDMLIFDRAHKARAFQLAQRVHVFMNATGEPATMPFIEYAWGIGKDVYVPKVDARTGAMLHCKVDAQTRWAPGSYGIPEPQDMNTTVPDEFFGEGSAIVVPLLVFNDTCHRIGYGKGYYDKFLKNTKAMTFGIAYDLQYYAAMPVEEHDISLNAIATEQRWYTP